MKALRKLLSLVIVLALIGGGVTYALTPSVDIKKSEKLENIKSTKTINDLNSEFARNVSYKNSKALATAKIDDDLLASILQNSVGKDSQLLEGSFKLVGNGIEAKLPVKLGLWNTQISTKIRVLGANNKVELILEDAKIGKVPIPDFALEKYLKEYLTGTGVSVNGNVITINKVELPVKLEGIEVSNGMINVSASLTNEQLLQYGSQALKGYLGA